jgi:two-component system cell cycle response regulator
MQAFESPAGVIHKDATISSEIADLANLMLGLSPDGIALVDHDTLILRLLNESAVHHLASSAEVLIGQPLPLTFTAEDPQEFCIEKESGETSYISVRKQAIVQGKQRYWLLSIRDVTVIVEVREQLRSESINDELTNLLNRRGFLALGQHALSLAEREKRRLLVIFIDLDGMKSINDKFGHQRGDAALIDTANLLRRTFRKSDVVARMGGDEYAVIAQCKNEHDRAHIQRRLRENLEALYKKAIGPYKLSLSVGMVEYDPETHCALDVLLERADAAMYEAKRARKDVARQPYFESA